jgi:hypothetical protein
MAKRKIFCSDCGTEISKFDENNDLGYCPNEETWCENYIEPTYQIGDTLIYNNEKYVVVDIRTEQLDNNDIPLFMLHYYTDKKRIITEFNGELIKIR